MAMTPAMPVVVMPVGVVVVMLAVGAVGRRQTGVDVRAEVVTCGHPVTVRVAEHRRPTAQRSREQVQGHYTRIHDDLSDRQPLRSSAWDTVGRRSGRVAFQRVARDGLRLCVRHTSACVVLPARRYPNW